MSDKRHTTDGVCRCGRVARTGALAGDGIGDSFDIHDLALLVHLVLDELQGGVQRRTVGGRLNCRGRVVGNRLGRRRRILLRQRDGGSRD